MQLTLNTSAENCINSLSFNDLTTLEEIIMSRKKYLESLAKQFLMEEGESECQFVKRMYHRLPMINMITWKRVAEYQRR